MSAIQLGIGQSVGRLAPKARRDVLYSDFHIVETVFYPQYCIHLFIHYIKSLSECNDECR